MSDSEFKFEIEKVRNAFKEQDRTSVSNDVILWWGFIIVSGLANIASIIIKDKHSILLVLINSLPLIIGATGLASTLLYSRIQYPPKFFYKVYALLWFISICILVINFL